MGKKNKKHHFKDQRHHDETNLDQSQNNVQQNIIDVTSSIPTNMSEEMQKNEMSSTGRKSIMTKYWNIAIGAVILVTILIVVLISGGKTNKDKAIVDSEESLINESVSLIQGSVIGSQKMKPVEDGEFVYTFENIDWVLTPQESDTSSNESSTAVAFYFEGFTRRNGVVAQFNRPYKLGVHEGACNVVESLTFDTSAQTGIPLSYVTCRNGEIGSDIVLFQEDQNIVAKQREIAYELDINTDKQMVVAGEFTELYTIPLNTVIR